MNIFLIRFFNSIYSVYTSSSGAHSRASSLAEENEGYVPMQPSHHHNESGFMIQPQSNAMDYMDMVPGNQSSTQGDISSATSSCSITSGTPSTDMRFSEYHLDKVVARFTPSEDDEALDRPLRTYSVGSKLEHNKRKHHVDRVSAEQCRIRAFSVGSRVKVKDLSKSAGSSSNVPQSAYVNHEINNNNNNNSKSGKKSSSAPLLNNNLNKTHGSVDPMEDLMEIDYTPTKSTTISNPVPVPKQKYDDYMNMSGRSNNSNMLPPTTSAVSGYVEMKPGGVPETNNRSTENYSEYLDMRPGVPSRSPTKTISTPKTVPLTSSSLKNNGSYPSNNNYMDMSPRSYDGSSRNRMTTSSSSLSSVKAPSDDYLNMSPVNKSLIEVEKRSSVTDGYMEMSWNNGAKNKNKNINNNGAFDQPSSSSDEYINMDYSNNNDGSSKGQKNDRSISLPIAIQKNKFRGTKHQAVGNPTAKTGSIEGPPVYLPLSSSTNTNNSSVSPTRTRCDSRDSGIMTPSSGSNIIFPFSPGSPIKQFDPMDDNVPRKCLVDGSSGTIKLSEEDTIEEEPRTPIPVENNIGMFVHKAHEKQLDTLSDDYAVMNLGEPVSKKPNLNVNGPVMSQMTGAIRQNDTSMEQSTMEPFLLNVDSESQQQHDYVNCVSSGLTNTAITSKIITPKPITPSQKRTTQMTGNTNSEDKLSTGDYAIMNPSKKLASPVPQIQPQQSQSTATPQLVTKKSLLLTITSQEKLNNVGFKPICEDDTQMSQKRPSLSRQVSEKRSLPNETNDYEILRPSLSRPNSVNSEKITKSNGNANNRPSSANSERLGSVGSISSSFTALGDIRSQSSSTTTIRLMDTSTSAIPSPMNLNSRPESVSSDTQMTSRPPSVSSDRELHYASLDLPPSTIINSGVTKMDVDEVKTDQSSPSPNTASSSSSSTSSQPAFTYAQIDFVKSEQQKQQTQQQHNQHSGNQ